MTFTASTSNRGSEQSHSTHNSNSASIKKDELTVRVKSSSFQPSSMPEHLKNETRRNSKKLRELFNETLQEKEESMPESSNWLASDEIELSKLSSKALHSFVMKAEKLGKKVTYEKVLTVKITE